MIPGHDVSVNTDLRQIPDPLTEPSHQLLFPLPDIFYPFLQNKIDSCGQSRQSMGIQSTSLQTGGHFPGMMALKALNAAASTEQRCDLHALSDTEPSGSLGSKQPLMSGKADHIRSQFFHIRLKDSRTLGGIQKKQKAMLPAKTSDPGPIHSVSGHIGGMGTDDSPGIRTQQLFQKLQPHIPSVVTGQKGQGCSPVLQLIERPKHRVMFHDCGNHMVSRTNQTFDSDIQCLCGIHSKRDLRRILHPEYPGRLFSCMVYGTHRAKRSLIGSASGISQRPHGLLHRCDYRLRLWNRGGPVVKIDSIHPCLPFSVLFRFLYFGSFISIHSFYPLSAKSLCGPAAAALSFPRSGIHFYWSLHTASASWRFPGEETAESFHPVHNPPPPAWR